MPRMGIYGGLEGGSGGRRDVGGLTKVMISMNRQKAKVIANIILLVVVRCARSPR